VQGKTVCNCDYVLSGAFSGIVAVRAKVMTKAGEQDTSVGAVIFN